MKSRIILASFCVTALVIVTGSLVLSRSALAEPADQDPETKQMFVMGRGPVQILRLYDKPDPLGKSQKIVLVGMPIDVYTDQMYNKHWYKTVEGFYAHSYYLSNTDPNLMTVSDDTGVTGDPDIQRREDLLLEKYLDIVMVGKIMRREVEIGFTQEQVRDAWGDPDSWQVLETTALGDRVLWEFEPNDNNNLKGSARLTFDYRKKLVNLVIDR